MKTATLDVDATVIRSTRRAANRVYDGSAAITGAGAVGRARCDRRRRVPRRQCCRRARAIAASLRRRVAALPSGIEKVYVRGGSALYEHELMMWMDDQAIAYATSANMSHVSGAIRSFHLRD